MNTENINGFKIGDRVKFINPYGYDGNMDIVNETGTIVNLWGTIDMVSIEFDKNISGHNCNGRCKKNGYGWNVKANKENLKHINKIESKHIKQINWDLTEKIKSYLGE